MSSKQFPLNGSSHINVITFTPFYKENEKNVQNSYQGERQDNFIKFKNFKLSLMKLILRFGFHQFVPYMILLISCNNGFDATSKMKKWRPF